MKHGLVMGFEDSLHSTRWAFLEKACISDPFQQGLIWSANATILELLISKVEHNVVNWFVA